VNVQPLEIVVDGPGLSLLIARLARASAIAIDVEANGLHAFRPRLCTVQLAWAEDAGLAIAVVDTLAVDPAALAPVLGASGPIKVLHDLTFDARMLADAGTPLARVRDTSIAARFLGHAATGLASVALTELGVTLTKRFQQHDWSSRPFLAEHLDYLAGDVRHLLALDERLEALAMAKEIEEEIAEECAHRLVNALAPPHDLRPAYVRIKGAASLDDLGRAVLRQLVETRDALAATADVPPFKVIGGEALLELARIQPTTTSALSLVRGASVGAARRHARAWIAAIERGQSDGRVPHEDAIHFEKPRTDRAMLTEKRAREARLFAWRRREGQARGIDEQAVLPGHCAQALIALSLRHAPDDPALGVSLQQIAGLGARRLNRYGEAMLALARGQIPEGGDAGDCPSETLREASLQDR
jgi:ribonuclease D